ncbi:MAG: PASTA domain-containing protein [Flavonifractor plautii]
MRSWRRWWTAAPARMPGGGLPHRRQDRLLRTLETDHTIVSFLGFAPADDPQVIILLAYDNPKPAFPGSNTTAGGWYISGGNMAALMAGELLEDILGHLGVEKTYTANADVLVPNLSGLNLADATSALQKNSLTLRTVGDGGTVTGQIPAAGASIPGGSQVVLYMGEAVPTDQVQVPSVIALPPSRPGRSWLMRVSTCGPPEPPSTALTWWPMNSPPPQAPRSTGVPPLRYALPTARPAARACKNGPTTWETG